MLQAPPSAPGASWAHTATTVLVRREIDLRETPRSWRWTGSHHDPAPTVPSGAPPGLAASRRGHDEAGFRRAPLCDHQADTCLRQVHPDGMTMFDMRGENAA